MAEESIERAPRAARTRAAKPQRKPWAPPSLLDAPPAPDGYKHRWIRAEVRGFDDRKNVSSRMREGWELVRRDEYPDFEAPTIDSGRYEGVFGVGGLLLARIPVETIAERNDYFGKMNTDAMTAVDNNLMKETQHHSMAIQKPERQSRVTFGGPK
jgi:hypothetical protein